MQSPKTYREKRPWGEFIEFTKNSRSTVKILIVNPHEALSLQKHKNRDEFWYVISGTGTVTVGQEVTTVSPHKNYFIPKDTNHRVEAGDEQLNILEISFGDFDEGDVTRIEDKYGRIK